MQLAYLAAVARNPTWGLAARQLGVTPSALSQGIAELERRLGVELFGWEGRRRVQLPHTAEVVRYAERVLAETSDLRRWLDRVGAGEVGRLRIGMIDAAALFHFPQVMREFRAARPTLDVGITVAPTAELLDLLGQGLLDVAVCVDPQGVGLFDAVPLLSDELAVYAPPGTPAPLPPSLWGPWLMFPTSSRTRQAIDCELRSLGSPVVVEMESHQPDVLCEMVRLGMGWSVLPVEQAESGPLPLSRAFEQPLLRRTISAVTRRNAPLHPGVAELVGAMRATADAAAVTGGALDATAGTVAPAADRRDLVDVAGGR